MKLEELEELMITGKGLKTFVASDICTDSIDYAKACAQELLDKLREELP